jgi:transcriptional regulator with XRE-family HTH domain
MTIFVRNKKNTFMNIGENIKRIREEKGLLQKQVAASVGVHPSNYSKIEKGEREPSIEVLDKIAKLFGLSVYQIIHPEENTPQEVTINDKTTIEQMRLIQKLEEKDKNTIFNIIETMLTKKKFKLEFSTKQKLFLVTT